MTGAQLSALGIRLEAPQASREAGTSRFPARVVLPAAAERAVVAPLGGTVEAVLVDIGDSVRVGQPLVKLFSADLGELKATLLQLQAAERLARADRDRDRALFADGIIAARRMAETNSRHEVVTAQLAEAEQRLALIGAERSGSAVSAGLTLRAVQAGIVLARDATVGTLVAAGAPLLRTARVDRLLLEVQVPVTAVRDIRVGDRLTVPEAAATATITAIGIDAGAGTQSVHLRAEVSMTDGGLLRPGQAVEVEHRVAVDGGWSVPDSALVSEGGAAWVYVRTRDGFRAVPVVLRGRSEGRSVLTGALVPADRVAVSAVIAIKGAMNGHGGGE